MYESPDVDKLNGASPAGINDYVWMNTVAIGEHMLLSLLPAFSSRRFFRWIPPTLFLSLMIR